MQATILCLECNKQTMHHELGPIVYIPDRFSETFLVRDPLICPKCKKDVSHKRFALQETDTMMKIIATNVLFSANEPAPPHLKGIVLANDAGYVKLRKDCKATPVFVQSIQGIQREKNTR